ncbi:ATP-binding protein [Clostridium sp.]|uniref:ATP-binding protein n=1 Tax=Clostridium sp. TaxID=1506 RepID=UPI0039F5058E
MRIKRIYIKDFGIFRDEKLEDLNGDIIVIGGHNRAGKTTFMKLFRHLGFGFGQNTKDLPKPNVEYGVNYDVECNDGELFNVEIIGNRLPSVKGINIENNISIEELYGNVDYFTYKQLFTITLDELQNTSLEDSKEVSNMQSILLGAGFKEIIHIPKFIKEIQNEAQKIGGVRGNPSTKQFKIYNKEIKEGIRLREKAKTQVEEYYEKSIELKNIEIDIEKFKNHICKTRDDVFRLELIKNNFATYGELKKLKVKMSLEDMSLLEQGKKFSSMEKAVALKEEYNNILHEYNEEKYRFLQVVGKEELKDKLLSNKNKLLTFSQGLSGIKEKINNYRELKNNCIRAKEEISRRILGINEKWKDDFAKLMDIKTDIIEENKLGSLVREEKELYYKKRELSNEIKALENNRVMLEKTFGNNEITNIDKLIKRCFYISICIIILGALLCFVNYNAGIVLSLSGAALGGTYGFIKYSSGTNKSSLANVTEMENINKKVLDNKEYLEKVNEKFESIKSSLKGYRKLLDIDEEISGETLIEYFRNIKEIKNSILSLQNYINKLKKEETAIKESLMPIVDIIGEFSELIEDNYIYKNEDIIKHSNLIFEQIEKLNNYAGTAEKLSLEEQKKVLCERKIKEFIGEYDKEDIMTSLDDYIKKCKKFRELKELKSKYEILERTLENACTFLPSGISLENFKEEFNRFISLESVEEEYNSLKKKLKNFEKELQSFIEKRESIRYELQGLYSTKNVEYAQEKIDEARKSMYSIAKRYGTLRAAEFILKKVQDNFVERTKDFLLKDASSYLSQITRGEYYDIQPVEDLSSMDFKTAVKDGTIYENSNILSRATKEQLFLSVRLSRIKEITPPLPIILDDSFVNFDESHTKSVLKLLTNIAKQNQIFITTCHPRMVEYIGDVCENITFLKLEKGKFNKTSKEKLIDYLKAN